MGLFDRKPNIEELEQNGDVEGLIRALKYKKNADVLNDAAYALGEIGDERAVQPLIEALDDDASYALGEIDERLPHLKIFGDKRLVESLIKRLPEENWFHAFALGLIGDERAIEPLEYTIKELVAEGDAGSDEMVGQCQDMIRACRKALKKIRRKIGDESSSS